MPSPGESSKSLLNVVFTTLLLLIPGSLAMRLAMGTPATEAKAKDGSSKGADSGAGTSEKSGSSGPQGGSPKPPAAAPACQTAVHTVVSEYCGLPGLCPSPSTAPVPAAAAPSSAATAEKTNAAAYCARVDTMLALVPERSLGLDGALESLLRAFESAEYTLVRVARDRETDAKSVDTSTLPLALLFSRPHDAAMGSADVHGAVDAQLVLLVEDTPNQGIDETRLTAALDTWNKLAPHEHLAPDAGRTLRVLGPTFSGSAHRLGWLLGGTPFQPRSRIRVLSGTATSRSLARELGAGFAHRRAGASGHEPTLEVSTTVRTDDDMMSTLWLYLIERLHARAEQIALVVESSTGYGQDVAQHAQQGTPDSATAQTDGSSAGSVPPFQGSLILPVPLGLGQIKAEWERQGRRKTPETPQDQNKNLRHIGSNESAARGLLTLFDRGALNRRDLTLSALLTSLCQENIEYVGIMLTNPEDKAFLAERIAVECPDVRLFSTESDIGYLHREHYQTMRGMLIASTYPLYGRNVQWSYSNAGSPRKRLQFASQTDQGVYNATLFMLNRPDILQEYTLPSFEQPGKQSGYPPVWVSAVARDGMMPLYADDRKPDSSAGIAKPYAAQAGQTPIHMPESAPSVPKYTPYDLGTLHVLLLVLSLAALLHGIAYFRNQHGRPLWVSRPYERSRYFDIFQSSRLHNRYSASNTPGYHMFVLFATLWIALVYLTLTLTLRFRPSNLHKISNVFKQEWAFYEDTGYAIAALLGISALFLVIADIAFRQIPNVRLQREWHRLSLRISRSTVMTSLTVVLVSSLCARGIYAFNTEIEKNVFLVLFLRRSSQTTYEMSLLVPGLSLCLVGYIWGVFNLRRLQHVRFRWLQSPVGMSLTSKPPHRWGSTAGARDAQTHSLQALLHRLPLHYWIVLILGTGVALLPVLRRLTTIDHWLLSWVFRASMFAAVLAVTASMVRLARSWYLLREQLHLAAHHPIGGVLRRMAESKNSLLAPLGSLLVDSLSRYTERTCLRAQCLQIQQQYQALDEAQRAALALSTDEEALPWQRIVREATALSPLPNELATRPHPTSQTDASPTTSPDAELEALLLRQAIWTSGHGSSPASHASSSSASAFWQSLQDLLGLRLVIYLHHVVAPLREALMFVSLNLVLLLLALNSYPFQPHESIGVFIWISFLAAITLSAHVLIQMNRDPILSLIAGADQGKLRWDSGFSRQMLLYVLAPLLTLLASKIPSLGWLSPLATRLTSGGG